MTKHKSDKLHFYGHNCFLTETPSSVLITDPWFSNKGAFFGSWFQYPDNSNFKEDLLKKIKQKKSYVYITHEHQDHFDEETIREFIPNVTFLIPSFQDKYLENKLKHLGSDVVTISDSELTQLNEDLQISVYISDIGVNHDSAILIKTNSFTFLNQNDCKIFDVIKSIDTKIDYYSVQYSGASWHPVCYENYSEKERVDISNEKSQVKIKNVMNAIKTIKPKFYIPAAGPAIFPFLDLSLSSGKDNIFTHQNKLHKCLSENGITNIIYAKPGDEIIPKKGSSPISPPTQEQLLNYQQNKFNYWEELDYQFNKDSLIKEINLRLEKIIDIPIQDLPLIIFNWGNDADEEIRIDLNKKKIVENSDNPENFYRVHAEKKYFSLMHSGHRWQDIYLSLRAKVTRIPDEFNNLVNVFIFSDISNIKESMLSCIDIPQERITIEGKDGHYEIDRYCPHNSGDLCQADVNDNNEVVCPRHGWKFSLSNQGKVKSGMYSINAKKIIK